MTSLATPVERKNTTMNRPCKLFKTVYIGSDQSVDLRLYWQVRRVDRALWKVREFDMGFGNLSRKGESCSNYFNFFLQLQRVRMNSW